MSSHSNCYFVYFDLEATGLTIPPDIIQIGAITQDGSDTFDEYVRPNKHIDSDAAKVIGMHTDSSLNVYKTGKSEKLPCRDARTVLTEFLGWLRRVSRYNGGKVALVAYNAFRFDTIVLLYHLKRLDLRYSDVIHCFVDPYWYVSKFRLELCERPPGKPEYRAKKLVKLMEHFGIKPSGEVGEHNAKWDADNLRKVVSALMKKPYDYGMLGQEETKKRLLAVDDTGKIFVKTPEQFVLDMKRNPSRLEKVWLRHF